MFYDNAIYGNNVFGLSHINVNFFIKYLKWEEDL